MGPKCWAVPKNDDHFKLSCINLTQPRSNRVKMIKCSKGAKAAIVRSIYKEKKGSCDKIKNYRPLGIENELSKIYDGSLHNIIYVNLQAKYNITVLTMFFHGSLKVPKNL